MVAILLAGAVAMAGLILGAAYLAFAVCEQLDALDARRRDLEDAAHE